MRCKLGQPDRLHLGSQIVHVTFIDEEVSMQVTILDNLGVKVSVLLPHEFDGSPRLVCAHVLNDRLEVTRQVQLLVHILRGSSQEG